MIQRLGDLLRPALAHAGLEATSALWKIGDVWEKALGAAIASHAAPVGLRRGELTVAAPAAVWRQELTFLGPDIKLKLNAALGEPVVERVRIVAGPAFAPDVPESAPRGREGDATQGERPADDRAPGVAAVGESAAAAASPEWLDPDAPAALRAALSGLYRATARRRGDVR